MNSRIIDAHTSAMREEQLVASVLDTSADTWGVNTRMAMSFAPTFWDDPVAGRLAAAVMKCVRSSRPPTTPLVFELLNKRDKSWLTNPTYTKPIGLEIVEHEAEDLVQRYTGKRLQAVLGRAWSEAKEHPERSKEIAKGVIVSLKEFV